MERYELYIGRWTAVESADDDVVVGIRCVGVCLQICLVAVVEILVVDLRKYGPVELIEHLLLRTVVLVEVVVHVALFLTVDEIGVVVGCGDVNQYAIREFLLDGYCYAVVGGCRFCRPEFLNMVCSTSVCCHSLPRCWLYAAP